MYHYDLLLIKVAGADIEHLSVHPIDPEGRAKKRLIDELKAGIFPNAVLQRAYTESASQELVTLTMEMTDELDAWRGGFALIEDLLHDKDRDVRTVANVGDWLGKPGIVTVPDGTSVYVTDVYKFILMERLFTDPITVNWRVSEATGEPVASHLLARDDHYDQAYRDVNGQRVFFGYTRVGEDTPVSTIPVSIDGLIYPTIDAAAVAYNIPVEWVYERLDSDEPRWQEWRYANTVYSEKTPSSVNRAEDVVPNHAETITGGGNPNAQRVSVLGTVYGSIVDAVRANANWELTPSMIHRRLRSGDDPEIFYCDAEGNRLA